MHHIRLVWPPHTWQVSLHQRLQMSHQVYWAFRGTNFHSCINQAWVQVNVWSLCVRPLTPFSPLSLLAAVSQTSPSILLLIRRPFMVRANKTSIGGSLKKTWLYWALITPSPCQTAPPTYGHIWDTHQRSYIIQTHSGLLTSALRVSLHEAVGLKVIRKLHNFTRVQAGNEKDSTLRKV